MPETVSKLRRAKARLLGMAAEEIPVAFQLKCDCGHVLEGTRRTGWQQAMCPNCQAAHFVLPVNVYPATGAVASEVIGGSFAQRLAIVVAELFPAKSKLSSKRATRRGKAGSAEGVAAGDATGSGTEDRRKLPFPRLTLPKIDVVGSLRRTFTPFRLLMLAMAGIVVATSAWMLHQRNLENARNTWRASLDQVAGLLEDADLKTLQPVLADAVAAGMMLGHNDAEYRRICNLYQETETCNTLAHGDLLNALFNACSDNGLLKTGAGNSVRLETVGQRFVFGSSIRPISAEERAFAVDLPITPGRNGVQIRIALPALAELVETIGDRQFLFAAKVENVIAPPENSDGLWRIDLQPDTFVLITSNVHCRELGLPIDDDEALQQLLERQRNFLEASTTWADRNQTIVPENANAEP